ncbi:MAG: RluA family pseudouridine synthase [Chitinophagales bacterium]
MENPPLRVLFEDKHLLAVNKPAGIVVEDGFHKNTLELQALAYIKAKDQWPWKCFIGVPHRIDRPVTGVVLFSKKRNVLKLLVEQFKHRELKKIYYAIVEKRPAEAEAELVHWHRKNDELRKAELFDEEKEGTNRARLKYKVVGESPSGVLLEVQLITGKFHQIRAQLAKMGCPIVGDEKYGSTQAYKPTTIALHARRLEVRHPVTGEQLTITAPLPEDEVWRSFAALGAAGDSAGTN